jgi:hypothetical protein
VSIKKADDACGGVTNADLKTTQEEYRAPIARKKLASRLRQAVTFVEGHHGGRDALNMMLGNQRIGKVTFKSPGVIGSTEIDEGFRGLGLGRKMYGEAARRAPGGRLISDGSVSPEAQNVWQSMMRRPAHGVETKPHEWTRPTTRALESGEKVPAVRWSAPMDKATPSEGLYSTQLPAKAVMSKVGFEKMDEESWKQTLRDIPLVILATGLGWGVGKTVSGALGEHLAREGVKPAWTKHIPAATALLSSLGSYAMGRSRAEMARRREEARSAADPTVQVGEKLASEFSYYVGKRLAGGHP